MELELSAFLVRGEPIPYTEAVRGEFKPFRVGDPWGPAWSSTWFHVRGRVPDGWAGKRAAVVVDLGWHVPTGFSCEALAWKDGKPWRGVDPNHNVLPVDGSEVDFYLEAAANPLPTLAGAEPAVSMIELRTSPDPLFVLNQLELVPWQPPAASEARIDLGAHAITAVGHAHIDTAWLWPLREVRRKCARSWSSQVELMDHYPDFVFACSQPAHHPFWWEGIDGTRVFTHFPPADTYNGDFTAEQVEHSARNFKDAASSNQSLYLFGYGDGGGGATAEMIKSAHSLSVPMGKAIDFFDSASA